MNMYLRYWLLLPLWALAKIINYPLAPFVVLFTKPDGFLPNWLWWFQTTDNPVDGDRPWKAGRRPFKKETDWFHVWVNRTFWLWRNSMYGFRVNVLGYDYRDGDVFSFTGNEHTSDNNAVAGVERKFIYRNGKKDCFQFYLVYNWPGTEHCLRINLGWKIFDPYDLDEREEFENYNYVFGCNPFMGFGH